MVSNTFFLNYVAYEQGQEVWEHEEDQVKGIFGRRNLKVGFHNPSLARNHKDTLCRILVHLQRYLLRQDPLSMSRHPLCYLVKADYRGRRIDELEAMTIDFEAATI
ncbi:hypothetical protein GQ457_09G019870 [Hibiscus cannabinus]